MIRRVMVIPILLLSCGRVLAQTPAQGPMPTQDQTQSPAQTPPSTKALPPSQTPSLAQPQAASHPELYLAVSYGVFSPTSSTTRSRFGSTWQQLGLGWFEAVRPRKWSPVVDITWFAHSSEGSAFLAPLTVGVERGFSQSGSLRPYAAVRVGAFYGNAHAAEFGASGSTIGFNANASLGVIFEQRYFVEARYDYFTRFASSDFSGLSIFGGVRVASISL
jgi:hypothetical protein